MTTQRIAIAALGVALFMSIDFGAAASAAAQGGSSTQSRATAPTQPDSTISYPLLTLNLVVDRALNVNPIVAAGTGGVQIARADKRMAAGAYIPTLTANSAALRTDVKSASSTTGGGGFTGSQTYGLSAALDLFTGGRRRANERVASAYVRAAGSTLVADRYAVTLIAEQGFYEVIRATDLVQVAQSGLAEANQLLRFTTDMYRAGTVTKSDLLRAQLQSTTLRQQLLAARDTLLAASYTLGWLAGVDGPVGAMPDSASEAIRPLAIDDTTIVRLAVESSPSVAVADAVAAATRESVRAARTLYVPTITANAGRNWAASTPVAPGSVQPGWTVTVATSFPVFNGFQREDAVTRAEVAAYVARVTVSDTRRSARASAAQLLGALSTTTAAISLGEEAIRSSREDLRVQTARYRAGISTMLDVLTSEAALLQAEYSLVLAQHRYHITRAALQALVGRAL